jgi:hypothetical protein
MGFLSTLGKIGKGLLGAVPVVGDIASVLGAQEEGKAKGKEAQANLQLSQDRNAIDRYRSMQDAEFRSGDQDLARKGFETQNRGDVFKQNLIGALLSGKIDPVSISGGKASGGILQALQSNPEALGAAQRMMEQAGQASVNPLQFKGGNMVAAPQLSQMPQVDKGGFLSSLARIGQLAGASSPYIKRPDDDGGTR